MTNLTARPTTYKGVHMRSRLEATFASYLDALNLTWEYEPCAFGDESGQYLPDFRVTTRSGATWYVETKGAEIADPTPLQERMEIIWASDPTARLFLCDKHDQWWFGADGSWRGLDGFVAA